MMVIRPGEGRFPLAERVNAVGLRTWLEAAA